MKDLLLCVHVVVKKKMELEISRCHSADTSKNCTKARAAGAARLFFIIQPIRSLFSGVENRCEMNKNVNPLFLSTLLELLCLSLTR